MVILERMKNVWDKGNNCPENCTCDCCCADDVKEEEKFEVRKNLTDEEIEEIIEKEYKDKNDRTKHFIRKSLKKYGDRFTYYKSDIPKDADNSRVKAVVTCRFHGDFEITAGYFSGKNGKGCYECKHGEPLKREVTLETFIEELHKIRPYYSIIPGVSKYVNNHTDITLHCDKHNQDFSARPSNLLWEKCTCTECKKERLKQRGQNWKDKSGIEFIKNLKENFSDQYDFSETKYDGFKEDITFKCKICGETITKSVCTINSDIKNGRCFCTNCGSELYRIKRENKFKETVEKRFPNHFDLTNVHYIGRELGATGIKCLKCGKTFDINYPGNFMTGAECPHCDFSIGESMVRNWLENNKKSYTSYIEHLNIDNSKIVGRRCDWGVEIDFVVYMENITYWIEYNGEQHYTWCKHFQTLEEFNGQLKRDENVRNYCKNNKIILIEIPFKYNRQEQINEILNSVILNNKDPEEIIITPPINYYRTKKEKEEAKKNGEL